MSRAGATTSRGWQWPPPAAIRAPIRTARRHDVREFSVRSFGWILLAALPLLVHAEWPEVSAAELQRKSGYALTDQRCGEAPRAFPKLRIGMRDGYCAGLVASKQDGLIFPRSIVQIPGQRQFVIADMGGWNPGQGRLLLLDPDAPEDKRITSLIDRLDFPFGL